MPISELIKQLKDDPENEALRREAIEALANALLAEREKVFEELAK